MRLNVRSQKSEVRRETLFRERESTLYDMFKVDSTECSMAHWQSARIWF